MLSHDRPPKQSVRKHAALSVGPPATTVHCSSDVMRQVVTTNICHCHLPCAAAVHTHKEQQVSSCVTGTWKGFVQGCGVQLRQAALQCTRWCNTLRGLPVYRGTAWKGLHALGTKDECIWLISHLLLTFW